MSATGLLVMAFGVLGEARSGRGYFADVMRVRPEYAEWHPAVLWLIGYVSFPAKNLVSLMSRHDQWELGERVARGILPAFLGSLERGDEYYVSLLPHLYNNVPTYIGWAWLDGGWVGVIVLNVLYGVVGGAIVRRAIGKGGLVGIVYLAAVATCFFNDHLFWFPGLVQMALVGLGEAWIAKAEKKAEIRGKGWARRSGRRESDGTREGNVPLKGW